MDEQRKEYSEDDSFDKSKTAAEYGNSPKNSANDNSGNNDFGKTGIAYDSNTTTGSGYSERERSFQDGTNDTHDDGATHHGSEELVDKYNINDQAHAKSSIEDFVPTTSAFRHADDPEPQSPGTL